MRQLFDPLKPSGYYIYQQLVLLKKSYVLARTACFLCISEQTAIICICNSNGLVFHHPYGECSLRGTNLIFKFNFEGCAIVTQLYVPFLCCSNVSYVRSVDRCPCSQDQHLLRADITRPTSATAVQSYSSELLSLDTQPSALVGM